MDYNFLLAVLLAVSNFFSSDIEPVDVSSINHLYFGNIQYGLYNDEVFDMFVPTDALGPTGLVIEIHGGGFIGGSKNSLYNPTTEARILSFLEDDIAYALIDYRLVGNKYDNVGIMKSLLSTKRALQYIRYYAEVFNIDPTKIVLKGSSAGAGASMWLAYQPDMANGVAIDPVEQESTTVLAVSLANPQATYDALKWESEIFDGLGYSGELDYNTNLGTRENTHRSYAVKSYAELVSATSYRSSVDMLNFIATNGGVPTFINCTSTLYTSLVSNTLPDILHSPYHSEKLKEYLDTESTENVVYITGLGVVDPTGETEIAFLKRHLQ